jgi:hypothetical protein
MPDISTEQRFSFTMNPFPEAINREECQLPDVQIYRGEEALARRVLVRRKKVFYKWYARYSGRSLDYLLDYANDILEDEERYPKYDFFLKEFTKSKFFIGEGENGKPELHAFTRHIPGRAFRDIPFWEFFLNPVLRKNTINLFFKCDRFYKGEGRVPDLVGSRRLNIFGREIFDPTIFLWPFKTTNIIVQDNNDLVLVDVRTNKPKDNWVSRGMLIHRELTIGTGHLLKLVDKLSSPQIQ